MHHGCIDNAEPLSLSWSLTLPLFHHWELLEVTWKCYSVSSFVCVCVCVCVRLSSEITGVQVWECLIDQRGKIWRHQACQRSQGLSEHVCVCDSFTFLRYKDHIRLWVWSMSLWQSHQILYTNLDVCMWYCVWVTLDLKGPISIWLYLCLLWHRKIKVLLSKRVCVCVNV